MRRPARPGATVAAAVLAGLLLAGPAAAEPARTAVFPVELLDTSGEGPKPGQAEKLATLSRLLREELAASGRYAAVDLTPFAAEIERASPLYRCGGCQLGLARRAGARYAVDVIVRKMSTLVQEMALIVADVEEDRIAAFHSVSIRNDSEEAWRRGLLYLLRNRLLRDDKEAAAAPEGR